MVRVTRRPIRVAQLVREVADPRAGAVVTFLGTTRSPSAGRRVLRLEYEAYASMAEREMRALGTRATRRWRLRGVSMVHRLGVVPVGEASVGVAVAAAHRPEAFAACRWLIDRLKRIVPIWKREHLSGHKVWVGLHPKSARPARAASQRPRVR